MSFEGYRLDLSIKGVMMWERMFGGNYNNINQGEYLPELIYCLFCASNPQLTMRYGTFKGIVENNKKIAKWVAEKMRDVMDFIGQFPEEEGEEAEPVNNSDEDVKELTITDMATSLIVDYGVSADYVMNQMGIWEIGAFYKAAESNVRRRYEENRLWAFMQLAPHMDPKSHKGPAELIPFPWEKEKKLDEKTAKAALDFLNKYGKRRNDNSPQ